MTMSARRTCARMSGVREWHTVTWLGLGLGLGSGLGLGLMLGLGLGLMLGLGLGLGLELELGLGLGLRLGLGCVTTSSEICFSICPMVDVDTNFSFVSCRVSAAVA